jgi:hypothetical protein
MVPRYSQIHEIRLLKASYAELQLALMVTNDPKQRKRIKDAIYQTTEALLRYAVAEPVTNA